MSWYGWLLLAFSVLPMPWAWRSTFRASVNVMRISYTDWFDVSVSAFIASLAMFAWPLVLMIASLNRALRVTSAEDFAAKVGGETRGEKLKRREREVAERERHIRDLERELEVV